MPTKRVVGEEDADSSSNDGVRRTRRQRGEARAELLEAARHLFNDRGYADTSTREIAERAAVSETLMFRYFGSKAGLYRAAVVQPFLDFVDEFTQVSAEASFEMEDEYEASRQFLGGLYDVFHNHGGLVTMFFAAETALSSDLAESGVLADVSERLQALVDIGREQLKRRHHVELKHPWLTTRVTLAMVAGMATFGSSFYGSQRPSRVAIIDELAQVVLHGHVHRAGP
jgi:AcrR family transcriptional regulator